ncbi:hypothetical protein [Tateyamaria sp. syn59]|uniref:hypothetical protein n=1 Tax=Tateyamaria sp. syn59 TaxID=2576942 RepID=UPI0011BF01AF|nr:hypothetical protein [Tateyamaria sp. syn59]
MTKRTIPIIAIAGAAGVAALLATSFVGDDVSDLAGPEEDVSQLAEPPTADIGGDSEISSEPMEDIGEEAVPAIDQPTTEMLTDEVEDETIPPLPGTDPVVLPGDEVMASQVESEAEAILGTEAAGSNEGLAVIEEALASETFDYDALLEAIGGSPLEESRKAELLAALEKREGDPEGTLEVLREIHAELVSP